MEAAGKVRRPLRLANRLRFLWLIIAWEFVPLLPISLSNNISQFTFDFFASAAVQQPALIYVIAVLDLHKSASWNSLTLILSKQRWTLCFNGFPTEPSRAFKKLWLTQFHIFFKAVVQLKFTGNSLVNRKVENNWRADWTVSADWFHSYLNSIDQQPERQHALREHECIRNSQISSYTVNCLDSFLILHLRW